MKNITRRSFIRKTTTAAAIGAFTIVPRHVLGGKNYTPPSDAVYIACIGAGGRASSDIHTITRAGAKIVALCDVDDVRAADAYKKYPEVNKYKDFRKLLEKEKNIDGVIVATPDHTHAVATMAAMQRGKHVYCEKPLTHTIYEARKIAEAAKKYKVATQMGNQGHATEETRLFCEWIADGAIGNVKEVHGVVCKSHSFISTAEKLGTEKHEVPEGLDWDLWLGPMPHREFNKRYAPKTWRSWRSFGSGTIGDWTCHVLDPAYWALDLGAPKTIIAEVDENYDPKKHFETFAASNRITFEFDAKGKRPPVKVIWYDGEYRPPRPDDLEPGRQTIPGQKPIGALIIGEKGNIQYGSHGAESCRIIPETKMRAYQRPEKTMPRSPGHAEEWLIACKGGKPAGSNFGYAGPLTEIALLGVIATLVPGTKLQWNAEKMEFTNCPEANKYIHWKYRKGWDI